MALKIRSYIICLVVLLSSCTENSFKETIASYGFYKNNQCSKSDSIVIKREQILHSDTFHVRVYFGNILTDSYKEYTNPVKGIFRLCADTFYLIYPFEINKAIEMNCSEHSLFASTIIEKKQSKSYEINGNDYEVKSFVEYAPPYGDIVSYYNIKAGFFCYYIAENNSYLLMNNLKNAGIDVPILKTLEQALIYDTTYFGEFVSKKLPHIPPPTIK